MANRNFNDLFPLEHPLYSTNMSTPSNWRLQYASHRSTLTRMLNQYTDYLLGQNHYTDSYDDKLSGLEEGISTLKAACGNIQGLLMEINEKMKDSTFCSKDSNGDTPDMPSPEPQKECEVKEPDCSEYIYLTLIVPLLVFIFLFALLLHHGDTWKKLFSNAKNLEVDPHPRSSTSPASSLEGFERDTNQRSRTPPPPVTWFSYLRNQMPFMDFSLDSNRPTVPNSAPVPSQNPVTVKIPSSCSNPLYREYRTPSQDAPQQYEMRSFSSLPPAPPLRTTSLVRSSVITPGNVNANVNDDTSFIL